ncbi:MAG: hypothetical protein KF763_15395 [Cyclobacteriaceae bacterium]|nr:hypothetical protein [Cyclobacteriaceae bacterium]
MLESISWQEFLTTVALLLGGYYAITTLLLYSREITNFFNPRKSVGSTDTRSDQSDSLESQLLGSVRLESAQQEIPREESTDSDAWEVAAPKDEEETIAVVDLQEESLKKDLVTIQAEISSLAEIVSLGTREEAISLFKTLLANYPQFSGTPFRPPISQFIHESCEQVNTHQFDLSEINSWWEDSASDTRQ